MLHTPPLFRFRFVVCIQDFREDGRQRERYRTNGSTSFVRSEWAAPPRRAVNEEKKKMPPPSGRAGGASERPEADGGFRIYIHEYALWLQELFSFCRLPYIMKRGHIYT